MTEQKERTMRNKIAIAVVIGLVAGLLVGWIAGRVGEKADAAVAEPRAPLCNAEFVCQVSSARDGVNKAKAGRLGRNARGARYTHADADVILNALMGAQSRAIAKGKISRAARLNRTEMWQEFRRDDNCVYKRSGTGSGTWAPQYRWSCQWGTTVIPDLDLNSGDVRGMICTGGAGVSVGVALAASAGGPPAWIGIGTGWTICMFQGVAERAADR